MITTFIDASRLGALAVLLLALAACAPGEATITDLESESDSGEPAAPDAQLDGGAEVGPDAGDGEEDAGWEHDAGETSDAGVADAGEAADAGHPGDAGTLPPPSPSEGCTSGSGLAEGPGTISVNGTTREYTVRLPIGYATSQRVWPLVLALHPNGSNNSYWDSTSGSRDIRGLVENEAVLILPEARTGNWTEEELVDLTYFDLLIDRVKKELCVDTGRIFSMGFSGGGSYSGMLGCHRTDIRAFVAGGAIIYFDQNACVGTPAAWITIGTGELTSGRAAFRDFWRDRNQCSAMSTPTDPDPCVAYSCPSEARPVHYCQHPDGHVWPAFGTGAAWDFFSQF